MKRILIFSLAYYPKYVGGAEVALKEITDRIDPTKYAFDMITCRFDSTLPREEQVGNIHVYRIGFALPKPSYADLGRPPLYFVKVAYPLLAAWKAIGLHKKRRYDAFWGMMSYMGFPVAILKFFYKDLPPFLLTLQEGDTVDHVKNRLRIRAVAPLYRKVFAHADMVQTISFFLEKFAREMGYKGEVAVIPNAVDVEHFSAEYNDADLAEVRTRLLAKEDDRFIITTSRLVGKNAIDQVILAMKYLPPSAVFLVLGEGPDEEALKELAEKEGVAGRVRFLGRIAHADLPKYLKLSHVFVRPSRSEGMGNSFIEAMAAEIPVVATAVGGIVDFLYDPEQNPDKEPTGLFAKVDDPKDIAAKIERFLLDADLRTRCVKNAHLMVVRKYDWNLIAVAMQHKVFVPLLDEK